MVCYTDWFVDTEKSLHPWDKVHLIMVYDPFNGILNLVCYIVLRIFCIYVHQWYWAVIFFFVCFVLFFFLILVSEWWWLHRMSLGVFLPLQIYEIVWKVWLLTLLQMFDRICLLSLLVLDFCLLGVLKSQFQFQYLCLICSYFLFLLGSALGDCNFLRICPFPPDCPLYWHTVACSK